MARKGKQNKDDEIFVEATPLSPEDERLDKLFDEMEAGSLKTLEDAARQIITLSTTLLGAFFGLLAFKDVPSYLGFVEVKWIGAGALLAFFAALFYALRAVSPKRYAYSRANLTEKRNILQQMLETKRSALNTAAWAFGLGILLMLFAALDILIFRI